MKLTLVDHEIDSCRAHIATTTAGGSEVEAFLTRYLLVRIYAAFEEQIESLLASRIATTADRPVQEFAKHCVDKVFRSIKISEIAGLLGKFGPTCKAEFSSRVTGTVAETMFGNIVLNRHQVAHQTPPAMTLEELVRAYEEAHKVLDAIDEALRAV